MLKLAYEDQLTIVAQQKVILNAINGKRFSILALLHKIQGGIQGIK